MEITPIRFKEIAEKTVQKLLELDREEAMEFFLEELDLDEEEKEYFEISEDTEQEFACDACPYYWTDGDGDIPYCHYDHDDGYAPCEIDNGHEE